MKFVLIAFFCSVLVVFLHAAPVEEKNSKIDNKPSKSAFGQAFDEIVVESHLTVRRKSNNNATRQGRNQNTTETGIIKTKRDVHASVSRPEKPNKKNYRHQFNSNFGASSTSSQNFSYGTKGFITSGTFSGTQRYNFNGQNIDISFSNSFSDNMRNIGPTFHITVTGPQGNKKVLL